jgi:hypothetical protein
MRTNGRLSPQKNYIAREIYVKEVAAVTARERPEVAR